VHCGHGRVDTIKQVVEPDLFIIIIIIIIINNSEICMAEVILHAYNIR
jgi:hypothetical protein